MTTPRTEGLTLDAGALIAVEAGVRRVVTLVDQALRAKVDIHVVAGVIAQVWRGGHRQARVARLLDADGVHVAALDADTARAVGELCGRTRTADVVDAHVVLHAREHGHTVVTSDPDDLRRIDPGVQLIVV